MKKATAVILTFYIIIAVACGCDNRDKNVSVIESLTEETTALYETEVSTNYGQIKTQYKEYLETRKEICRITSVKELDEAIENRHELTKNYLKMAKQFITMDVANGSKWNVDNDLCCIVQSIEIGDFEIIAYEWDEHETYDLYFSIAESQLKSLPVGNYHYVLAMECMPYDEYYYDFGNEDLVKYVEYPFDNGCISWKNGKATSYEDQFNAGVYFTVGRFMMANSVYHNNTDPILDSDERTRLGALKLFGIENFTKGDSIPAYWGFPAVVSAVKDIKQISNGRYEVDLQLYADIYHLVPSHRLTITVSETDDPIFKYCFEKSEITYCSQFDPAYLTS